MKRKITGVFLLCAMAMCVAGCGKEEKLVLVTTEETASSMDAEATTEDELAELKEEAEAVTETAPLREEATATQKSITLQDIYTANTGDALLSTGENHTLHTIYYYNGEEQYSESQFLGFAEDGTYMQAYQDATGVTQILDKAHGYWYYVDENGIASVLIYPEPTVSDAIISENHNDMIISLTEAEQTITDVYREDGTLCVETDYDNDGTAYVFKYFLDDNYKVLGYDCYEGETLVSHSWVTIGEDFSYPESLASVHEAMMNRTITIKYPESAGLEYVYEMPINLPLTLRMLEYQAYSDEACTTVWTEEADSQGFFKDEVIYLKKQ